MLRANGDPVRHGTAQEIGHGIGVFGRVEVQPGALGVLYQQPLPFQAAADALADQVNQFLQFAFIRCLDAFKSGWAVVAIYIDAIQKQGVKVNKVN